MRAALALSCLALIAAAPARPDAAIDGRRIFTRTCAPCHGSGPGIDGTKLLPGTAALELKYKGEHPAALEQRGDLEPEVLRFFVRHGSGAMPMFRKTEISDAEIDAVARYLKQAAKRPK